MHFEDLQKLYGGKFIAIEGEETVLASGATFNEVIKKLEDLKISKRRELSIRYIKKR